MATPHNNEISLRFFKVKNTTCYFYTVQTPLTLHLRPEDGSVQGPKHVVFSLNKRLLQILQLCFDTIPPSSFAYIKHNGDIATRDHIAVSPTGYLNWRTFWHGLRWNKQICGGKYRYILRKNGIHIYTYINTVRNSSGNFITRGRKITMVKYFRPLQFKNTKFEAINTRGISFFSVKYLPIVVDTKRPKILLEKEWTIPIHGSVLKSRILWKKKTFSLSHLSSHSREPSLKNTRTEWNQNA
jgi:hypothetical protein